ncbi:hypothetical protein GUITHDRAFT_119295 [Guillardia theta CCMP2712]|uniref:PDZ domain-containing protein n=1 Tax=Guillardia theta (strain CCMP2712) TaxID=905079 RepID=L1IFB9_GUITC|nr:hypothetical protein GUITHDRAFT_119295 [Guillardia theta CCMP2712]EKX34550.1 hypothetical protein GUITHDRAFT_119295 [Guillardia theta CCMP2712]|mmetsp:Transcript_7013/g.24474  ORF Transcript_7013/g.24474 Transcript_7013/m.24474 type:complete len:174 (+) Transcript_7013:38-559(+)|eukprot:XP_005821530.1 hypothetical protein GUITHDRAFT_119295 [Guillardia theta CCMP2712]
MGTTQSILDIDDGQGIHDWMHENFFFRDPRWKAMKRQLRRRVSRSGGWKGVSNKWGIGIKTSIDVANSRVMVDKVYDGGPADQTGCVDAGDRILYIDAFDISELFLHFDKFKDPDAENDLQNFTLEDIVDALMRGDKGSIVRLGLVKEGQSIVTYKSIIRDYDYEGEEPITSE